MEKRFVPAFEKIGKVCHIYLTRHALILLHNVLTTDGVQAIAELPKDVVFDEYRVTSQNEDRIAFTVDLSLLARALRSSHSMDGEQLQIKLVKKSPTPLERALPYLTFESKGHHSAILQDVPVSLPLTTAEVHDLQEAVELVQELPPTLVQLPELVQLQGLIERLKNMGEVLEVGVAQYGDLTLRMTSTKVSIGTQYRQLRVWGERANPDPGDEALSASDRLQQALARGQASAVKVNLKHFARSLHCHLTKPDASFCGVVPIDSCLLMMFQYAEGSISLQYRLPVLDMDD